MPFSKEQLERQAELKRCRKTGRDAEKLSQETADSPATWGKRATGQEEAGTCPQEDLMLRWSCQVGTRLRLLSGDTNEKDQEPNSQPTVHAISITDLSLDALISKAEPIANTFAFLSSTHSA